MREGLSRPLWLAVIIVAFCIPLFVGLGRTDLENDEAIYSFAVDGILATGDWLNPPLSPHADATFLEKPPLKFWLVAAPIGLGLFPHNEVGLRVWDALFGAVSFLYVFVLGRRLAGPICGAVAVFVLFVYGPLLFVHGLRNNNMEAPLVLAYSGGVYHYLGWASSDRPVRRRAHACAVWACFFLGFMTKFVAAFSLPLMLGFVTLVDRTARRKLLQDVRVWLALGACFIVVAAPWFVYQTLKEGSGFWRVLIGEHVYLRFTGSLDPGHVKPWSFYFTEVFAALESRATVWLAIAGGSLLIVKTMRERRLDTLLIIVWFALPLTLMSIGTSKLHHYVYPFLPPVALAAGYAPAWLVQAGRKYVDSAMQAIQRRLSSVQSWHAGVRYTLLGLAVVAVLVSAATLVFGPIDWRIREVRVFRNSHVARPLGIALVLATLAGRGGLAARLLWPVALLLAILPVNAYEDALREVQVERHPLRSARDCLVEVRRQEREADRPAPGIYAIGEKDWFLHSHFYYLHRVGGWERTETLDDRVVADALFTSGRQRPVLMNEPTYRAFKARHSENFSAIPILTLPEVLVLMPGPYAVCGPKPAVRLLQ